MPLTKEMIEVIKEIEARQKLPKEKHIELGRNNRNTLERELEVRMMIAGINIGKDKEKK